MANGPDQFDEPQLPPELAERLRAMHDRGVDVPPEVDRAILGQARRRMSHLRRFRLAARWGGAAAAIAATLLLAFQLLMPGAPTPTTAIRDDRPTMLDAYRLVRLIESGRPVDPRHDYNGDGVVDGADIDALARSVVRLDGGVR